VVVVSGAELDDDGGLLWTLTRASAEAWSQALRDLRSERRAAICIADVEEKTIDSISPEWVGGLDRTLVRRLGVHAGIDNSN